MISTPKIVSQNPFVIRIAALQKNTRKLFDFLTPILHLNWGPLMAQQISRQCLTSPHVMKHTMATVATASFMRALAAECNCF